MNIPIAIEYMVLIYCLFIFQNCLIKSRKAIYDLIESHGNQNNLIYFAVLMKDYERVIQYYIQHKDFEKALEVLREQVTNCSQFAVNSFSYKF